MLDVAWGCKDRVGPPGWAPQWLSTTATGGTTTQLSALLAMASSDEVQWKSSWRGHRCQPTQVPAALGNKADDHRWAADVQ